MLRRALDIAARSGGAFDPALGALVDAWGYVTGFDRFRRAVLGEQAPECTVEEAAWGLRVGEELLPG